MKIFFRKHGNSLFYIFLPVLFLVLTVAFIQLTPKSSRTAAGDSCIDSEECCTSSGCGAETGEACDGDTCVRTNVGCEEGEVDDDPDGECECILDGAVVGECVVCELDESFVDGACIHFCVAGEDPDITGCVLLEGQKPFGCSISFGPMGPASGGFLLYGLAVANLGFLALRFRRKK